MNMYGEEDLCCYFHPKEVVVGVCALCLKERLLSLASKKQGRLPLPKDANKSFRVLRKTSIALPKVFTLGSFIQRFEPRTQKTEEKCGESSIASLEDSFISIKFEPDGCAAWESKRTARASVGPSASWIPPGREEGGAVKEKSNSSRVKSVVEHPKMRGTLRWRKGIGQLLQLVRWKRSSKAGGASHAPGFTAAGNVEDIRGRRAWIRNLTRRRTTSTTI